MFVRLDNPKSVKTREGGGGVLEVIRFSPNLDTMDFRYRLTHP
jgi:hypothetical protein